MSSQARVGTALLRRSVVRLSQLRNRVAWGRRLPGGRSSALAASCSSARPAPMPGPSPRTSAP
eukprot:8048852-Alexandrium_andersonii.AAC.1